VEVDGFGVRVDEIPLFYPPPFGCVMVLWMRMEFGMEQFKFKASPPVSGPEALFGWQTSKFGDFNRWRALANLHPAFTVRLPLPTGNLLATVSEWAALFLLHGCEATFFGQLREEPPRLFSPNACLLWPIAHTSMPQSCGT
jgi:hypothetical protein